MASRTTLLLKKNENAIRLLSEVRASVGGIHAVTKNYATMSGVCGGEATPHVGEGADWTGND